MSNRIALDLKQFKHLKSDDKSTTLQHEDGHTLTLAHKSLSPAYQKQLQALAGISKNDKMPTDRDESKEDKQQQLAMADGGNVNPKKVSDSIQGTFNPPEPKNFPDRFDTDVVHAAHPDKTPVPQAGIIHAPPEALAEGGDVKKIPNYGKVEIKEDKPQPIGQLKDKAIDGKKPKVFEEARKMYADPDGLVSSNDSAPIIPEALQPTPDDSGDNQPQSPISSPPTDAPPLQEPNAVPPQLQQVRDKYNDLVKQQYFGKTREDKPGMPTDDISPLVFGQDNKPPEKFLAPLYEQAEKDVQSNKDQKMGADMANRQQTDQENQVRARAGLSPLPAMDMPTASTEANPTAPGQIPGASSATDQQADRSPNSAAPAMPSSGTPSDGTSEAMSGDPSSMLAAGYKERMQGINQQAQAQGQLGEQQAKLLNDQIQGRQEAQRSYQDQYSQLEQERQAHMADIRAGYIDPNKYWTGDANGNGGHSRMAAGIGMIIAGFNPTSRPNAAIDFVKYQMEQNLEAQKQNLGAKQNLLTANLRQFGNLRDASDMTRIMQNDIVSNELQAAAAKAQTPMAKASALQAAGQLQMETAPMFQQFAMRRAMMNLASNPNQSPQAVDHMLGYMRMVNPEQAKEMESRYVPGVGLASTPIPAEVRSQLISKQQFGQAVQDLKSWSAKNSGSLSPSAIAEGRTKAANVQNLYRQGINGGVFKQGEQSFINGIIDSSPDKFFNNIRVLPKLNEAARENDSSLNILKRGYGLPTLAAPQQSSASGNPPMQDSSTARAWATDPKNAKDPRAAKILKLLGK